MKLSDEPNGKDKEDSEIKVDNPNWGEDQYKDYKAEFIADNNLSKLGIIKNNLSIIIIGKDVFVV